MLQNFKADIIYYNTAADFELEFNLCGCCRMRLLNDKCADKKTLLSSLSRAFSRSRIIILTAPLFDGGNIIKTVSTAIGKGVEEIDAASFGINSDASIEITKSSTPLVTADGVFGGCIIESGPQTLIILTDNKSVRKKIMKDLIHPYIQELVSGEATPEHDPNEIITDQDEPYDFAEPSEYEDQNNDLQDMLVTEDDISEDEETSENEELDADELIIEADLEGDEEPARDEDYYIQESGLYTEEEEKSLLPDQDDDPYSYEEGEYFIEDNTKEKNSVFNLMLIIISAILLLAIAVLCFCVFFIPSQSGTTPAAYLQEIFDVMLK